MKKKFSVYGIFIWFIACLYFFYEYFLRVFMGTVAGDVMKDLDIQAEKFALLGSAYYLTYSMMQTPVGILIDKYGVKILLTIACLIANIGVFSLALANNFYTALLGRFLLGFGSSFAFVSLLVIALNWFPREHFGFMTGLTQFLGSIGPVLAGAPLAFALDVFDNNWRLILFYIGIFGITLNFLILFFIKTTPAGKQQQIIFVTPEEPLWSKIKELLKNRQVWITVLFAGCIYSSVPLLGAFWGTSFMQSKGLDRSKAATIVSLMWIGLAIGALTIGKFSDVIKRRKTPLMLYSLLGILSSGLILFWHTHNALSLSIVFFCIGFSAAGQSLSFAVISEHVPRKLHATAIGLNNTFVMFFGFLIPPVASYFIQSATPGQGTIYTESAFEYGLSIMPIMYLIAFFLCLIGVKETFCRQQHEIFTLER
jgi:MFS family permease